MQVVRLFARGCMLAITASVVAGCAAGIKGRSDTPRYLAGSESYYATDIATALAEATTWKTAYAKATSNPDEAKRARNNYAFKMLEAHGYALQDYARSLSVEGRGGNFALSVATIGLTGASTIIRNSSTQSILSGIATGLLGIQEGFSKEVLLENTVDFLLLQMTAKHLQLRKQIISKLDASVTAYPLAAVDLDLSDMSRVTSFEIALGEIKEEANAKLQAAEEAVDAASNEIIFQTDEATNLLRDLVCLNADCTQVNQSALAATRACIKEVGISDEPDKVLLVDLVGDKYSLASRLKVAECAKTKLSAVGGG